LPLELITPFYAGKCKQVAYYRVDSGSFLLPFAPFVTRDSNSRIAKLSFISAFLVFLSAINSTTIIFISHDGVSRDNTFSLECLRTKTKIDCSQYSWSLCLEGLSKPVELGRFTEIEEGEETG
jgi:hypothetical protein